MLDLSTAPDSIRTLCVWLEASSYTIVNEQASGVFNQFADYRCGGHGVRITSDRGDWSVALGMAPMGDFFHPDEWEAFLDGFDLAGDLSGIDHQVEFITTRWSDAIRKAAASNDAERQIRRIGADYVQRRFGFIADGA